MSDPEMIDPTITPGEIWIGKAAGTKVRITDYTKGERGWKIHYSTLLLDSKGWLFERDFLYMFEREGT